MNFKDYIFILTLFTILLLAILSPTSKPEFLEVCVEEEIIPVYIKSEYELFLDAKVVNSAIVSKSGTINLSVSIISFRVAHPILLSCLLVRIPS